MIKKLLKFLLKTRFVTACLKVLKHGTETFVKPRFCCLILYLLQIILSAKLLQKQKVDGGVVHPVRVPSSCS